MAVPRDPCGRLDLRTAFVTGLVLALTISTTSRAQVPREPEEELVVTGGARNERPLPKAQAPGATASNVAMQDPLPKLARFRIGSNLFVHPGAAGDLALSPDDKTLVSWGDGAIVAWDAESGKQKWESNFDGEWESKFGTRAICFSSDGEWVYSQSEPNELLKWNSVTGKSQLVPAVHSLPLTAENRPASALPGAVRSVDVSKLDGRIAAAGGHGIVVYDSKGMSLFELPNSPAKAMTPEDWHRDRWLFHGHYSFAVFSPDGRKLAAVRSQSPNDVCLFDATTGKELGKLELSNRVVRISFSPSGESLVALQRDGAVAQWKVDSSERQWLASKLAADANLLTLQYTPDGKRIVVAGDMLHVIDAGDGSVLAELSSPSGPTRGLAVRSDAQVMYSVVESGRILRWDLVKLEFSGPQLGIKSDALFAAAAGSDKYAFVDLGGKIHLCDTSHAPDAQASSVSFAIPSEAVVRLAMSRNGKLMAAATANADELNIHFFELRDDEPRASTLGGVARAKLVAGEEVTLMELSPSGNYVVASIAGRGEAMVWDTATGKQLASAKHPSLNCLSFSGDGEQLVTGGGDDKLRRWDCRGGNLLSETTIEGGELQNVRCSPTDDLLVTAHFPNVLRFWKESAMTLKKRVALSGETNFKAIDFSSGGNWLATTSSGYLLIVDTSSGDVAWKNALHPSGRVTNVGFSTKDEVLLSVGVDGIGYCWNLIDGRDAAADFKEIWSAFRDENANDARELQWKLVQLGDPVVDAIAIELDPVKRVLKPNAITRGLNLPAARRRIELIDQLSEKDSAIEIESRVRLAMKTLVLLRSPAAIGLLKRLAADHANEDVRKEAMFALEQIESN